MKNRNLDHKDHWETPLFVTDNIKEEFGDYFDPCPIMHNTELWDGLEIDWHDKGYDFVYCNPPYNNKDKSMFIKKAIEQSEHIPVLCLIPDARDTKLYFDIIEQSTFIEAPVKSRIPFIGINKKGQCVNYHLKQNINDTETIFCEKTGECIDKHVTANGQHSSVFILFYNNPELRLIYHNIMQKLRNVVIDFKNK